MITEKMAFSPQEAAMATGLCLNTIYKLLKQRRLQAVKIDRKLLIPRKSLESFLSVIDTDPPAGNMNS
jgi:excisionase family DNA binding protein